MIYRTIKDQIQGFLFKKKIIILYGARQVGKTTLVKEIQSENQAKSEYFLADYADIQDLFSYSNVRSLVQRLKNYQLIILDEAQRIAEIGLVLKILHTELPDLQIIVTGSSSFDLASSTKEALTGRSIEFELFGISFSEINHCEGEIKAVLELKNLLLYGSYPEVYQPQGIPSIEVLKNIAENYLYKDILNLAQIGNFEILQKLLQALAYQIGQEVSLNELARLLQSHPSTIKKYINVLEKSFIIFSLSSYSKNHRNELKNNQKIYFWDLGIRNYLIQNLQPIDLRPDKGQLFENFIIAERFKKLKYQRNLEKSYFWRNYNQVEIDYLEVLSGNLNTYEIKWNSKKDPKLPTSFKELYPNSTFKVINSDNFVDFIS